jgi:NADH-quinone oxidoreductase subunit M
MNALLLALGAISVMAVTALFAAQASSVHAVRRRAGFGAALALALALGACVLVAMRGHADLDGRYFNVDGVAAPFLPFIAALVLVSIVGAPTGSLTREWASRALLTGAMLEALVMAKDPWLVMLLWIGSTVPTYFDLRAPGGHAAAARVYGVHQLASTLLVGGGVLLSQMDGPLAPWSAPLIVLGICAREGIFPFHAWLPALYEGAPLGSTALFAQSQAGAYLLVRLVIAHPSAVPTVFLGVLGCTTAIYGALLALAQPSAKRALGYFAVSQAALVLMGLASGGLIGLSGGVLMIVGTGFAQAGSALALWCLEARRGDLRVDRGSGGHDATPALAGVFLLLSLAAVGLPGTLDFVAEDFVFHAALEHRPWIGIAMVLATALNGITVLRLYFVLFGGARRRTGEADLKVRERLVLVGMAIALLALGFMPRPLLVPAERTLLAIQPELAAVVNESGPQAAECAASPSRARPLAGTTSP